VALFQAADHVNYGTTTTALAAATLQTAVGSMGDQRQAGRPLNVSPRFLIVPQQLWATASILLASTERSAAAGTHNPLKNLGIEPRYDSRMGASGCIDPATGTAQTGSATNWLLAARAGENGAKTIEVGYLRGTGRAPQIRPYTLTEGQWGLGWDINLDIAAKALDWRALYYATGAS